MDSSRVLIAIPAWNEQGSIADVIGKVKEHLPAAGILVVNDGSTDSTAEVALAAGAAVVSLPFNVGVGGAMRTAFLYAKREGYQGLVQVDADGQHDPADLESLLVGLDDADIVVGTRFHPNSMYFVGGPRRWAMVLLSKALSRMNKGKISDPTSGFRSAGPKAINLFAVNYPAEYLGDTVGSLSIAIRHGLGDQRGARHYVLPSHRPPEQERTLVSALSGSRQPCSRSDGAQEAEPESGR
jgi:glycosyltransferase involved in cell wall biosynthesis